MNDIHCEECGKYMFSTEKTGGTAGAEATNRGFVYKIPFLYGIKDGGHFFCCKECFGKWLKARTTQEQRDKGNADHAKLKQSMEESKPELLAGIQRIQSAFEKLKKRKYENKS